VNNDSTLDAFAFVPDTSAPGDQVRGHMVQFYDREAFLREQVTPSYQVSGNGLRPGGNVRERAATSPRTGT